MAFSSPCRLVTALCLSSVSISCRVAVVVGTRLWKIRNQIDSCHDDRELAVIDRERCTMTSFPLRFASISCRRRGIVSRTTAREVHWNCTAVSGYCGSIYTQDDSIPSLPCPVSCILVERRTNRSYRLGYKSPVKTTPHRCPLLK